MSCFNLNFIAESKMGNLHKAGHISTWMRYSISSNFKNLSELVKKRFPLGNFISNVFHFEPIGNSAHTKGFSTLGKALLPLYLQMLIIQISTQTDSHKYRKVLELKKVSLKNESEVLKP